MKRKEALDEVVESVKIDKAEEKNQKLVAKAQAGDKKALAQLCEFNHKYIFVVMMMRTRSNRELSEDLTQDVTIKIMSNLANYQNTGFKFRSWVSRIIPIQKVNADNTDNPTARTAKGKW